MAATRQVRVFVASDVRVYREGICRLVSAEDSLALEGAAATRSCPARLRDGARPDVVLVDTVWHPDPVAARAICAAAGDAPVVALVPPDPDEDLLGWAGAGISGFLSWDASPYEIVDVLRRAAGGATPCSPDVAEALLRRAGDRSGRRPGFRRHLTEREAQIARLVADGLSNKAIAARLSIELATVKNHVHSVLEKLEVSTRGEAAAKLRAAARTRRPV